MSSGPIVRERWSCIVAGATSSTISIWRFGFIMISEPAKDPVPGGFFGSSSLRLPRWSLKRAKPSLITLADRARDAGQWQLAVRHYREALDRNPRNSPIWVQYGHALKQTGHVAEAEKAYRRAIELDPSAADPHLQLGHAIKLQGRKTEAAAAYRRALELDPALQAASIELTALGWGRGLPGGSSRRR